MIFHLIPGNQNSVVGKLHHPAGCQNSFNGIIRLVPGCDMDNLKYPGERFSKGFTQPPAGQFFSNGIHPDNPALHISGNHPVPNGVEGDMKIFPGRCNLFYMLPY